MGNSQSSGKMGQKIAEQMITYDSEWSCRQDAGATKGSQTEVFREIVPKEGVDFTDTFHKEGFQNIFTSDKVTQDDGSLQLQYAL